MVKNRETRTATLLAHLLMVPTFFWALPWLQLVPTAIFHGLFLFLAFTSLLGNELVERTLLLFTEQVGVLLTMFSLSRLSRGSEGAN